MLSKRNIPMQKFTFLVFAFVSIWFFGCKEQKRPSKSDAAETKEEVPALTKSEVENAVESLTSAMIEPKRSSLEDITSQKLTYGHSSGNVQDRAEFIDDLINGSFDFLSIGTSDESIHISGDTAITRHVLSAKGTNKGK